MRPLEFRRAVGVLWVLVACTTGMGYMAFIRPYQLLLKEEEKQNVIAQQQISADRHILSELPLVRKRALLIRQTLRSVAPYNDPSTSTEGLLANIEALASARGAIISEIRPGQIAALRLNDTRTSTLLSVTVLASGTFKELLSFISGLSTMPTLTHVMEARLERAAVNSANDEAPILQATVSIETIRPGRSSLKASVRP